MEYIEIPCYKGARFKIAITSLVYQKRSPYQAIAVYDTDSFGRCLILDGDIQTAETDHEVYDKAILKRLSSESKRLLILGGGDGYVAEMALKMNPRVEITVVELDESVVNTCREYLGQRIFEHPQVRLLVDDAFRYMKETTDKSYDGVLCDLTAFPVGYNDGKFQEFYSTIFYLSRKLLKDTGWIGVYADSNADLLAEMIKKDFSKIEQFDVSIPSFGELCYFLYGSKCGIVENATDTSAK
jgi:spermidine synthase